MEKNQVVSIAEITRWKNKKFNEAFNMERFSKKDGSSWWRKRKKEICEETIFKVLNVSD